MSILSPDEVSEIKGRAIRAFDEFCSSSISRRQDPYFELALSFVGDGELYNAVYNMLNAIATAYGLSMITREVISSADVKKIIEALSDWLNKVPCKLNAIDRARAMLDSEDVDIPIAARESITEYADAIRGAMDVLEYNVFDCLKLLSEG